MYTNFTYHKPTTYGQSCKAQVEYLTKEDRENEEEIKSYFFHNDNQEISVEEAYKMIDDNKGSHSKEASKFYMINLSPSPKELAHIENQVNEIIDKLEFKNEADKEIAKDINMKLFLQEYVNHSMSLYAQNFERNITIDDLVYVAKIEKERTYKEDDKEVIQNRKIYSEIRKNPEKELLERFKLTQSGQVIKSGLKKEGLNYHAHVIVSRYEKNQEQKKKRSFSPMSKAKKSRGLNGADVGFDRNRFRQNMEKDFDIMFNYKRPVFEKFEHLKTPKNYNPNLNQLKKSIQNKVIGTIKSSMKKTGMLPSTDIPMSLGSLKNKVTNDLMNKLKINDIVAVVKNPKVEAVKKTIEFVAKASTGIDIG